jgi:LuxR family maltose regulon positive regulatory protein
MEQSDGWVDVYAAGYFTAARALAAEGALDEAQTMIARARRLAGRRRLRQLELLAVLCELELRLDYDPTPEGARAYAEEIGLDQLAAPTGLDTQVHRPVTTAAALCRAKLALLDADHGKALDELRQLHDWAMQHGAARLLIDINILLAHALRVTGETAEARACFDQAVGTAMFQGIVRPFLDARRFVEASLEDSLDGTIQLDRFRAQFLKAMSRALAARPVTGTAPGLLSEHEAEILQHLSFGYSNKEIARLIGMSPDTVKYRLKSVFRKIGVHKRRDAVRVLRERGLIGETEHRPLA